MASSGRCDRVSVILLLLLSHLFKRHASLTQQYAGLQEGRVQRKITRSIKIISCI